MTVESALRAGAGKVQVATIESAAIALGVAMPEVVVFGLEVTDEGEIAPNELGVIPELVAKCDAVVAGPAMGDAETAGRIVDVLIAAENVCLVFDASALMELERRREAMVKHRRPAILTPHIGLDRPRCCSDLPFRSNGIVPQPFVKLPSVLVQFAS